MPDVPTIDKPARGEPEKRGARARKNEKPATEFF
jgi:hypothetical protein